VSGIEIRMLGTGSRSVEATGELCWTTESEPNFDDSKRVRYPVVLDGRFHTYQIPLGDNVTWLLGGTVTRFRLVPVDHRARIEIASIRVLPNRVD
jgi:hypothetical protein